MKTEYSILEIELKSTGEEGNPSPSIGKIEIYDTKDFRRKSKELKNCCLILTTTKLKLVFMKLDTKSKDKMLKPSKKWIEDFNDSMVEEYIDTVVGNNPGRLTLKDFYTFDFFGKKICKVRFTDCRPDRKTNGIFYTYFIMK